MVLVGIKVGLTVGDGVGADVVTESWSPYCELNSFHSSVVRVGIGTMVGEGVGLMVGVDVGKGKHLTLPSLKLMHLCPVIEFIR
jgi:hypothetical protein